VATGGTTPRGYLAGAGSAARGPVARAGSG
jgi:hypothetical protein